MMFADLHLHSHFSDGTATPEELAAQGRRLGFAALALCDHDTVEGCARMGRACARAGLDFIPGSELTAEMQTYEVHLLAYGLDIANLHLLAELAKFQEVRQNRVREMVACLNRLGVPLSSEAVFKLANCLAPGRPHVARALVLGGYCSHPDEAFDRFLKRGKPAWVPKFKMSAVEAVGLIHQSGGLAVLAHPGLNRSDEFIPELVAAGLDGLECFHTKHSTAMAEHYLMLAEQYQLLVTGGSDCHGQSKGKPVFGTIRLPIEHVRELKARLAAGQRLIGPTQPAPAAPEPVGCTG
jgi:3',5'-nucleoside bisphosphate phosphatase